MSSIRDILRSKKES